MGKTRCSCIEVRVSVWHHALDQHRRKRSLAKLSVFYSNELDDVRDTSTSVKQRRRTQDIRGTRRGEHFLEPTSMRASVLLSRKHRRERNTFCSCFRKQGNQHHARGMPVAWNCVLAWTALPTRTAACSGTLPLPSDAVAFFFCFTSQDTRNFRNRALESTFSLALHEKGQQRAFGTVWNARTPSCIVIPTSVDLHKQA